MLTTSTFRAALLAALPELDWEDSADDDGVYLAFTHAVLPLLAWSLDATDDLIFRTPPPPRDSPAAHALVARLYAFVERAAVEGDATVREAIAVELGEDGYCGLTAAQLLAGAGPHTRALAGR